MIKMVNICLHIIDYLLQINFIIIIIIITSYCFLNISTMKNSSSIHYILLNKCIYIRSLQMTPTLNYNTIYLQLFIN